MHPNQHQALIATDNARNKQINIEPTQHHIRYMSSYNTFSATLQHLLCQAEAEMLIRAPGFKYFLLEVVSRKSQSLELRVEG